MTAFGSVDGTLSVDGVSESANNASEQFLADWDNDNLAGAVDGSPCLMRRSLPKIETPTLSAFRLRHTPRTPEENSTISSAVEDGQSGCNVGTGAGHGTNQLTQNAPGVEFRSVVGRFVLVECLFVWIPKPWFTCC